MPNYRWRNKQLRCACCGAEIDAGQSHRAILYEPAPNSNKGYRQMRPAAHYCDDCIALVEEALDEIEGAMSR